jgi:hypothetical protein
MYLSCAKPRQTLTISNKYVQNIDKTRKTSIITLVTKKLRRNMMTPIIDISNYIDSEYKIKRDEMRKARLWVGDTTQVSEERWLQARAHREKRPSILNRLSSLVRI